MAYPKDKLAVGNALKLIATLDSAEKIRFAKFLESPFFVRQPALGRLFEFLRYRKEEDHTEVDQASLFSLLYPEEKPPVRSQKKKLINTLSDFNQAIKKFISVCAFTNDALQQQYYVAQRYSQRADHPEISGKIMKSYRSLIEKEQDGFKKHLARFLYKDLDFYSPLNNLYDPQYTASALSAMTEDLEIAFLYARLNLVCNMVYRQNVVDVNGRTRKNKGKKGKADNRNDAKEKQQPYNLDDDIEAVLALSAKYDPKKYPEFSLYGRLIDLGRKVGERNLLMEIFADLKLHYQSMDRVQVRRFLIYLQNYCTRNSKHASVEYVKLKLEIGKWGADTGILFYPISKKQAEELDKTRLEAEIGIQDDLFLDIVLTTLSVGGMEDQALYFIVQNIKRLPRQVQDNSENLSLAYYHFLTGQFEKAWSHVQKVDAAQLKYALRYHSLSVRIVYELYAVNKREYEHMAAAIATFRQYFYRNNLAINKQEQ